MIDKHFARNSSSSFVHLSVNTIVPWRWLRIDFDQNQINARVTFIIYY